MSDQNNADNWRLEESGDTSGRWRLEETEQNQLSPWELQEDEYEEVGWQPVEYARAERNQSGGWVLPSLVGLALIAVVSYGAWIGLTRLPAGTIGSLIGNNNLLTPVPTSEAATVAETTPDAPAVEEAPTDAPTATATTPPTVAPTEAPTLPPPTMVEERFATITSQYGVNARPNPAVEGDPLEILAEGDEFLVVDEIDEWLQVALPSGQLAWISSAPEFVTVRSEEMDVNRANQFRTQVGAPLLPGGSDVAALPPAAESEPITTTTTVTDSNALVPTTTAEDGGATPEPPVGDDEPTIVGTVNITAGLNARAEPSTTGELIALLPNNTELDLTARTADNAWLRSTLSESITIWVFADFIVAADDLTTLPVIEVPGISAPEIVATPETPAASEVSTDTTSVDSEPVAEETPIPVEEPAAPVDATASVNTILGTAVRAAPDVGADAIATAVYENVLTVIGRSADDAWIQVDLGEQQGWVQVSAVDLSVDLATLPVSSP